tara:strand:+ start:34 stop:402 length:369 start_codon:yes stop_codon:yes gene_type:complete
MEGLLGKIKGLFKDKELTRTDIARTYQDAMGEIKKSEKELGNVYGPEADNPYLMQMFIDNPDFYDWAKIVQDDILSGQKHWRTYHGDLDSFNEAKKDTNYFNPGVYDSLIQAYNFDKLPTED